MTQHKILFAITAILLLSGCQRSDVALSEIGVQTVAYEERIHINNCGGKAESEQTATRSFSTSIEGEGEFKIGYQQIIEGSLSAKYGQYRNTTKSQRLTAPAGTDMEFVLKWSEEEHAGKVTVDGETGTYTVRVPIAVEQVSSQDLGCRPTLTSTPELDGPFRSHKVVNIGDGVLANATWSDGLAQFSPSELQTQYFRVQNFHAENTKNTNGCGYASFDSTQIWFASAGEANIEVNGQVIAHILQGTDTHGYMFEGIIRTNDKICITPNPYWFNIIFGPDIYYHYDSFCYRYPDLCTTKH